MAFGKPPFTRDFMDKIIERRLGLDKNTVDTILRRDSLTPYEAPSYPVGKASVQRKPSILRDALAQGLSDTGQQAFSTGLEAGRQEHNFGRGLVASFGASLGAGAKLRGADAASKAEMALKERGVAADEKRAEADMLNAKRPQRGGPESSQAKYEAYLQALTDAGLSDQEIHDLVARSGLKGMGGGAGGGMGGRGGMGTDRFRLATALYSTGKTKSMDEAEIAAATMLRSAHPVGSISKVIVDPETFSSTTVRQVVSQTLNPFTQKYELIDEQGNIVSPQDLEKFQGGNFVTGTGGDARQPGNIPPAVSDFQGNGTMTEDQVLNLLDGAKDRSVIQAYAAGKGTLGNSTAIKLKAAQLLQSMPAGVQMVPSHGQANGLGG